METYTLTPTWSSEKKFQASVLKLANTFGWSHYSIPDSKISAQVKRTKGFPDLVLCRPPGLIFAELKLNNNYPTKAQREWGQMLIDSGQEYHLWKPRDWDLIIERLSKST